MRTGTTGAPRREAIMPMPGRKRSISPVTRSSSLGEDERREAVRQDFADVTECLPGTGLALRERERVEEQRREVVVQAVGQPCLRPYSSGKKCAAKNSFAIAGARRYRSPAGVLPEHRRIHVALVIGREHHRPAQLLGDAAGALDLRSTRTAVRAAGFQVGRLARRTARAGQGPVPREETRRARPAGSTLVAGRSTSVCAAATNRALRKTHTHGIRVEKASSSATISSIAFRVSSNPSSSSVVPGERSARPA